MFAATAFASARGKLSSSRKICLIICSALAASIRISVIFSTFCEHRPNHRSSGYTPFKRNLEKRPQRGMGAEAVPTGERAIGGNKFRYLRTLPKTDLLLIVPSCRDI